MHQHHRRRARGACTGHRDKRCARGNGCRIKGDMKDDWAELEKEYFFPTSKRLPVTLVRGEGTRVWDEDGQEYLDFLAGIASVSLGHCHPEVVKAIERQANQLMLASNNVY